MPILIPKILRLPEARSIHVTCLSPMRYVSRPSGGSLGNQSLFLKKKKHIHACSFLFMPIPYTLSTYP